MKRFLFVAGTLFVVIAVGCSSSSDGTKTTSQTGGAGGAPSGAGGGVHAGGTMSTGGGSSSGAHANSGGSGAVSTGGTSASAGSGGTGAGGITNGGATSTGGTTAHGGATAADSGAADGSADSGDGGVHAETLKCVGGAKAGAFARSCSRDSECFVAKHWAGCCHIDAVGLNVIEETAFASFETSCGGPPACGCCCDRVFTESGMTVASGTAISVRCVDGTCTTSSP